jgi:hypothetical protein
VRLVRDEAEHDEVGIQAVQAVPLIGLPWVCGVALRPTNVLHDFVLTLARHIVACSLSVINDICKQYGALRCTW